MGNRTKSKAEENQKIDYICHYLYYRLEGGETRLNNVDEIGFANREDDIKRGEIDRFVYEETNRTSGLRNKR